LARERAKFSLDMPDEEHDAHLQRLDYLEQRILTTPATYDWQTLQKFEVIDCYVAAVSPLTSAAAGSSRRLDCGRVERSCRRG
jgi:hypothetical protein